MQIYNNTDGSTGIARASKGNQMKFCVDNKWYKADFLGYEGASEFLASALLKQSNTPYYVTYRMQEISYNGKIFNGCVSENFLGEGEELITLERLYRSYTNRDIYEAIEKLPLKEKIRTVVDFVRETTGLQCFGEYLTTLLELDALVLNEDRHFHNIAVIRNQDGTFRYCPIFDQGAAYLSDTQGDYPLENNTLGMTARVSAKPFHKNFDRQMEACQELYGRQLCFPSTPDLENAITEIDITYGNRVSARMKEILDHQWYLYDEMEQHNPHISPWVAELLSKNPSLLQPKER